MQNYKCVSIENVVLNTCINIYIILEYTHLNFKKIFLFQSTGHCKGFAYVHFKFRADAAKAVQVLNGHGYDHLILNAEWSKPPQN